MPRRLPTLLLLTALSACATRSIATGRTMSAATATAYVALERASDTTWRATWHLTAPATGLRFERPASGFRRDAFAIRTPGFSIRHDGDHEVLHTDGAPVREIVVEFTDEQRELPREYEFVRRFTDGSVAIYTGHLVARPVTQGDASCDSCWIRRLRIEPSAGARVVVGGRAHAGAVDWTDTTGQGTFVFVGDIDPVETASVIAIGDPGLPQWVDARWRETLPRIFDLYGARLGASPATRSMVLFDYRPTGPAGHYYTGGVLPGLIQLGLTSRGWEQQSPEALAQVVRFLAHEAAHVWNNGIVRGPSPEDPWMHEGSADAMADRALLAFGLADEGQFLAAQTEALNSCRAGIGARSIRAIGRHATLPYVCGNVLALIAESTLRARGTADLFDLWRGIIAAARDGDGRYAYDTWLETWRALGASGDDVVQFRRLIEASAHPDSLVAALAVRGVRIVTDTAPPASYRVALGRDALMVLMMEDCNGRVSFNQAPEGLLVARDLRCAVLPGGAMVTAIGGHEILGDGHRAWGELTARCGSSTPVGITYLESGNGGAFRTVDLRCARPAAARPAYVRIVARPVP